MSNTTAQSLLQPSYVMGLIIPQMKQLRAAYEGGMIFKQNVMKKKPSDSAMLFADKIENIAAQPVCKSIVEEMIDIIFESEPKREIAFLNSANQPIVTPLWFEDFLNNADYENNTMSDVMEKAATLASVEGWSWIFVDLPNEVNVTNRPYLSIASAESVIDWEYDIEGATAKLECLRVIEYQDQEKTIVMQWEAGEQELDEETGQMKYEPTTASRYIIENSKDAKVNQSEVTPAEYFEFPWNYPIPAIQLVPVPDLRNRFIGTSDITEAADVQRELLRLEAEAFDSIRFSKPIIRAREGVKIPAGGGGIARGESGDVEVIEMPTADITQIREQQQSLIATLDSYLGRSSLRKQSVQTQSGVSIIEERRGLHRKAASRARVMQSTEEEIITLVSWLMNLSWVGSIEYNTDYEAKDTQYRLALLQTAKNLSANPVVQEIIDLEVIKLIAPAEQMTQYLLKLNQNSTESINNNANTVMEDNLPIIEE